VLAQITSGKYDDSTYQDLLKAQKTREEAIVEKAKKEHDRTRAASRAAMIQKEIEGQKELELPKIKVVQPKKKEPELKQVSTQEKKGEPVEYVEFSKNFNNPEKM